MYPVVQRQVSVLAPTQTESFEEAWNLRNFKDFTEQCFEQCGSDFSWLLLGLNVEDHTIKHAYMP